MHAVRRLLNRPVVNKVADPSGRSRRAGVRKFPVYDGQRRHTGGYSAEDDHLLDQGHDQQQRNRGSEKRDEQAAEQDRDQQQDQQQQQDQLQQPLQQQKR